MSDEKKRKLRLMNEVLPAPTPAARDEGPRQRTLAHMQRLLALASAGAALQAGCSRGAKPAEPGGVTAEPSATGIATGAANANTVATSSDAATATTTTTSTTTPTSTAITRPTATVPTAYAVVDPLPPPACAGVATTIRATARRTKPNGDVFEIRLSKPGWPSARYDTSAPPLLTGLTLVSQRVESEALVLTVARDGGAMNGAALLTLGCNSRTQRLRVHIDMAADAGVPISVTDTQW